MKKLKKQNNFLAFQLRIIFEKQKPLLQIETSGDNKIMIQKMMEEIGYECYSLYQGKLVKNLSDQLHYGDYLFVPANANIIK